MMSHIAPEEESVTNEAIRSRVPLIVASVCWAGVIIAIIVLKILDHESGPGVIAWLWLASFAVAGLYAAHTNRHRPLRWISLATVVLIGANWASISGSYPADAVISDALTTGYFLAGWAVFALLAPRFGTEPDPEDGRLWIKSAAWSLVIGVLVVLAGWLLMLAGRAVFSWATDSANLGPALVVFVWAPIAIVLAAILRWLTGWSWWVCAIAGAITPIALFLLFARGTRRDLTGS